LQGQVRHEIFTEEHAEKKDTREILPTLFFPDQLHMGAVLGFRVEGSSFFVYNMVET
jgi:hypothetical protein